MSQPVSLVIVSMFALAAAGSAQTAPPTYPGSQIAGAAGSVDGAVVNLPYTATYTTTTAQTMSDGSVQTQVQTMQESRDAAGRVLLQVAAPVASGSGAAAFTQAMLTDPAQGTMTSWALTPQADGTQNQAVVVHLPPVPAGADNGGPGLPTTGAGAQPGGAATAAPQNATTVSLGGKQMSGLHAVGTRTTTTYAPASDLLYATVTESWFCPELKIPVLTTVTDPMNGVRTTQMSNLQLGPPDAGLFQVPAGYAVQDVSSSADADLASQ